MKTQLGMLYLIGSKNKDTDLCQENLEGLSHLLPLEWVRRAGCSANEAWGDCSLWEKSLLLKSQSMVTSEQLLASAQRASHSFETCQSPGPRS
jgi:hypothetical protein